MPDRIDAVWAWISDDAEGEGIVGTRMPNGQWIPFIAADHERLEQLRPMAQMIADDTGRPIKLIRLSMRTDVDILLPKGTANA